MSHPQALDASPMASWVWETWGERVVFIPSLPNTSQGLWKPRVELFAYVLLLDEFFYSKIEREETRTVACCCC